MRAIGYIRVSTEGQVMDGVSLELQRAKLAAWASLHDADLRAVFADEGVSGARADRPGCCRRSQPRSVSGPCSSSTPCRACLARRSTPYGLPASLRNRGATW